MKIVDNIFNVIRHLEKRSPETSEGIKSLDLIIENETDERLKVIHLKKRRVESFKEATNIKAKHMVSTHYF